MEADKTSRDAEIRDSILSDTEQAKVSIAPSSRNYWWVNQGATYEQEQGGGYLWAPQRGKGGYAFSHWTNVQKLRTSDLVIHYANSAIRAVGIVREPSIDAPRPVKLRNESGDEIGFLARVDYFPLETPIAIKEIPSHWRYTGEGPFTQDGDIKQGYLFPLAEDFVVKLFDQFAAKVPDAVRKAVPAHAGDSPRLTTIRRTVEAMYSDPSIRQICLTVLADAIMQAHAISPTSWAVVMPKTKNEVSLDVYGVYPCTLRVGELVLVIDQDTLGEKTKNQFEITFSSDPRNEAVFESITGTSPYRVHLPVDRLTDLLPLVRDSFLSFVTSCAGRVKTRTHGHYLHDPSVVDYLRQELKRDLSQPNYGRPDPTPSNNNPLSGRIVKVAPGPDAKYWQECLAAGYICVGWDLIGDLRQYSTKAAFADAFREAYGEEYNDYQPKITEKANELWTLMELRAGDLVVANRGTSEVLGIGQVLEAGYRWRPDRFEYKHTVQVKWDTTVAKSIPKQPWWAMKTVAEVPVELYQFILGMEPGWPPDDDPPLEPLVEYVAPSFAEIVHTIGQQGMRIDERVVRRYHLALHTRGFVVLSGLSGTGKTWLAEAYARAVDAQHRVVAVAPNWTTNEDLLGFLNPLSEKYHDTAFSQFLRQAAQHYRAAVQAGVQARPFHLVLDEMNLARVEYYFAQFLSAMEVRARRGAATIDLGTDEPLLLPPNLFVIGTVNVDETTHGFADKVHDRAQLIELEARREDLVAHLTDEVYRDDVMHIWDAVHHVGPFTFRVLDEMHKYIAAAVAMDTAWEEALDEQLLQKVLPKIKGADPRVGDALSRIVELTEERFPLCHRKAAVMLEGFRAHGFTSYFG